MISRRATKGIAEAYFDAFTYLESRGPGRGARRRISLGVLYDFLFENAFDSWFLNAAKGLSYLDGRSLKEFLMCLHTGETVVPVTQSWTWKQREVLGQRILGELAEAIITARLSDPEFEPYGDQKKQAVDEMRRLLELDGHIYTDGALLVPEEGVLDEQEEQGVLERLFSALNLEDTDTLTHHLELSAEHYREERWDDSISNSRKVLELVLRCVASRHASTKGPSIATDDLDRPVRVRDYLQRVGLLEEKEKDAVAKIYGLLSDTGGHPYVAQRDQARLLRHYALTTCQFVMLRLKGSLALGDAG